LDKGKIVIYSFWTGRETCVWGRSRIFSSLAHSQHSGGAEDLKKKNQTCEGQEGEKRGTFPEVSGRRISGRIKLHGGAGALSA